MVLQFKLDSVSELEEAVVVFQVELLLNLYCTLYEVALVLLQLKSKWVELGFALTTLGGLQTEDEMPLHKTDFKVSTRGVPASTPEPGEVSK